MQIAGESCLEFSRGLRSATEQLCHVAAEAAIHGGDRTCRECRKKEPVSRMRRFVRGPKGLEQMFVQLVPVDWDVLTAAVAAEQPSHQSLRRLDQENSLAAELNVASGHQLHWKLSKRCCRSFSAVRRKPQSLRRSRYLVRRNAAACPEEARSRRGCV